MKDTGKECGCTKCKKIRKLMGVSECFRNKLDAVAIFDSYVFQKNKPFKVTFNEGLNVEWSKTQLEEKKLTPRDVQQREEMVKKLKGKMGDFKSRYGKRAKGVMYAVATQHAKKTP